MLLVKVDPANPDDGRIWEVRGRWEYAIVDSSSGRLLLSSVLIPDVRVGGQGGVVESRLQRRDLSAKIGFPKAAVCLPSEPPSKSTPAQAISFDSCNTTAAIGDWHCIPLPLLYINTIAIPPTICMARLNEPPTAPASNAATTTVATTSTGESVDACEYPIPTISILHDRVEMRTKSKLVRPEPAADIEEVKRRFIRQNRELAKNNSTQSLRIRSLELDVSRLLGENIGLRNEVLHLQNEVYTAQVLASRNAARTFKDGMRAKLAELCAIVDGIEEEGAVELPDSLRPSRPSGVLWRERQPLTEIMRESQMPTITEDKMFPRRTLGADDIRAIRLSDQSSNESPDLGPPPVARLDYEDPVKLASPLMNKLSPLNHVATQDDEELLPAGLAANLETRRRRRDAKSEMRRTSILPQSPQSPAKTEGEQPLASAILRTGAKRKLADREGEKPIKPPSKGDFTFSRKVSTEEDKTSGQTKKEGGDKVQIEAKPARRVLGDKSVNMSPRKVAGKPEKPEKENVEKPAVPRRIADKESRRRRTSSIPLPSPPRDSAMATIEIPSREDDAVPPLGELPAPSTPAAVDLFSPTPSIPSTKPDATTMGRGDTPPPSDLSALSLATSNGDGDSRPSRRARAAVNYAEPSLISKMRRPDKKMVDAISGIRDPKCVMGAASAKGVNIKEEVIADEGEAWKDLPPAKEHDRVFSPLEGKSVGANVLPGLGGIFTNDNPGTDDDDSAAAKPTTKSSTMSSLVAAGNRKRRHSIQPSSQTSNHLQGNPADNTANTNDTDLDPIARRIQELDLYDFKESSSPLTDASSGSTSSRGMAKGRTHQRRHSAVPKQESTGDVAAADEVHEASGVTLKREIGRGVSRRRSMML